MPYTKTPLILETQGKDAMCLYPQKPFKLYAAMFIWYESDIIEATIKNLLAEGCEKVYFIDNDSPDNTVEVALKAGGTHWGTVKSEKFSEALKTGSVMDMVREVSEADDSDRVWWMLVDADEFPTAPYKQTIYEYLQTLDDAVRCVGALWLNHVPAYEPFYISGFHPAEFQPEASTLHLRAFPYCQQDHAKHNLLRYDRDRPFITSTGGFHSFTCDEVLYEPSSNIWLHHFQWRSPKFSQQRIKEFAMPKEDGESRIGDRKFYEDISMGKSPHFIFYVQRMAISKRIYRRDEYKDLYDGPIAFWKDILNDGSGKECELACWYTEEELITAVKNQVGEDAFSNWYCMNLASKHRYKELVDYFTTACANYRESSYKCCIEAMLLLGLAKQALELSAEMRGKFPQSEYAQKATMGIANALKAALF